MTKNLKSLICCILALVFVAGTIVAVFADSNALKASTEASTEDASEVVSEVITEPAKETYLMGDMNNDGKITVIDARIALRIAVDLEEATAVQEILGDINGVEGITTVDARAILRVAVKLDPMFSTVEI